MSTKRIPITDELIKQVRKCMSDGLSVHGTCRIIGIDRKTWYEWRKFAKDPQTEKHQDYVKLFEVVRYALGEFEQKLIREISAEERDWKAKQFILKRRFSESWDDGFQEAKKETDSEIEALRNENARLEGEIDSLVEGNDIV